MLLKTAKRSGTVAWSPINQERGFIAVGTVANAIDDSFETTADLEVMAVDFAPGSGKDMVVKGAVKSNERFHRLAWSGHAAGSTTLPLGILAGGMVDGSIGFWNPAIICKQMQGEPLVARVQKHKGPVRGLDFNSFKPNLLASGATESEILIWDLANPTAPNVYTPGAPTQPLSDITCVAWNGKVEHILASTGVSGTSVVWDLRQKRPVISFTDSATRTSRSALAWNPDVATQVLVASDDDNTPIVQMWDLRNAHSPARVLTGHSRGILDMSWCPFDSSMLLTCGKDNRTICWNPNTTEIMCDLPSGGNWNFDARWSPKMPAILATASFDGSVNVYSLTDTGNGSSGGALQAPGWLKRPAGASFGFGGQLVSFSKKMSPDGQPSRPTVALRRPGTDTELLERADELNTAIQQGKLKEYCQKKINDNPEAEEWQFMSILFDEDTRRRLTNFVGFSREEIAAEVLALKLSDLKLDDPLNKQASPSKKDKKKEAKSPNKEPVKEEEPLPNNDAAPDSSNAVDSLFGDSTGTDDFLGGAAEAPAPAAPVAGAAQSADSMPLVEEAVGPNAVLDAAIKRAVICGEFEGAVDCCFRFGRMADALLLAATGGRELFQRTQERYLALNASQPFVKVTRSIVNHQLQAFVDESDPKAWKETLAILVTYATADEFASLSDSLATRLKEVGKDSKAATLCYICAGNVDRTVQIWLEEDAKAAGTPSMKLQSLIEKISVLLVLDVCKQEVVPGIVGDKYAEYAEVLASQGRLAMAMEYLLRANASNSTAAAVLRERIFNSDARNAFSVPQNQHPPFPFEFHNVGVAPARPKVQQPLSSGSAPQAQVFNAVADAFGDAFGAPMQPQQQAVPQAAPQPAQPQQPAPSAYAQAQQAFAASQPTQLQQHQQQATSYSAVPEQQPVNYAAQPQPQAVNYGGAAPQQPQATNYGAVPQQPQPQAVAPQATNYGVAAQAINYGGAPIQQLQQPQANNYGAAPASAPAPAPMQPQQQPHMPQATNYGATPQSAAVNYGAAPAPTPAPAAQPPAQQAAPQPAPAPAPHTLTQEEQYVLGSVANHQAGLCAKMPKKMAEDVVKKLQALDQKMRAGQVAKEVTAQMIQWCQALEQNNAAGAAAIQTQLTATVWDEHGPWLQATKRLVDQAKKG